MKKEYLVGGLAIVGAISLVAYLNSKSKPRLNSDGFFNAQGKSKGDAEFIPDQFNRKPSLLEGCTFYRILPNPSIQGQPFYGKGVINQNGFILNTIISYSEFRNAFYNLPKCKNINY
jgi:hypothetical protein